MINKLLNRPPLAELDNIMGSIESLAQCFIANAILSTPIDKYLLDSLPLKIELKALEIDPVSVKKTGIIYDARKIEVANIEVLLENQRIKGYTINIKGKLNGKKINVRKIEHREINDPYIGIADLIIAIKQATVIN